MTSLFESPPPERDGRRLPDEIRRAILTLKVEHPAFTPNEIATICRFQFDRPVHRRTVQRVLATNPLPTLLGRRFPVYRDFADPSERRYTIVRLYIHEGWSITSIACYFETTRARVYEALQRWYSGGFPGLGDQSRAPKRPATKHNLKLMALIRQLQKNPGLGEFRIHAALAQQGIHVSPRTCGRILALHRELYNLPKPAHSSRESNVMPFTAVRRHQWWSVDVRYLEEHELPIQKPMYVISVLDNDSRALIASLLTPRQDLTAYLIVLRDAMLRHGVPEGIVSDGGSIFKAKDAMRIDAELGIVKKEIDEGQPWQNYIETHFNIQRRMADYHFAQATAWSDLAAAHAQFFEDYNAQPHFAHRRRAAHRRAPKDVLGFVQGGWWEPAERTRLFRIRRERRLDRSGSVRYRHWRIYGERGLAGQTAAVWLIEDQLAIEHATTTLAEYRVRFERGGRRIRQIDEPRLYATGYQSPQPFLAPLDTVEWHPARSVPPYAARQTCHGDGQQLPLFDLDPHGELVAS